MNPQPKISDDVCPVEDCGGTSLHRGGDAAQVAADMVDGDRTGSL